MKHLRQLCAVALLTIALSSTALAGDIDLPGDVPPPDPPAVSGDTGATSAGLSSSTEEPSVDWYVEEPFDFWHDMLSMF